jgi:hypothetical protein
MAPPWYINGDYIIACSCDYGCPCNSNLPPSQDFCEGCSLLRIEDGKYEDEQFGPVDLGGFNCGFASRWPGRIHEGNGVVSFYVDAAPNAPQWKALTEIIRGQAGGPLSLLANTYSRTVGPDPLRPVSIQIRGAGTNTTADVLDQAGVKLVHMSFEPILAPGTRDPVYSTVVPSARSVYQEGGDQYSLKDFSVDDVAAGLKFAHPNKCGQYAPVHWKVP